MSSTETFVTRCNGKLNVKRMLSHLAFFLHTSNTYSAFLGFGVLAFRRFGVLVFWRFGVMAFWRFGILAFSQIGFLLRNLFSAMHYFLVY